MPAYFAMVAVTAIAAWAILLPFEFRAFGEELIAATCGCPTSSTGREAGYFDLGAANRVLLHTWSLSVEEQFYLVLPLLLIGLALVRRLAVPVLIVLWAASLAASIWLTPATPVSAFFLFPFRAWELLTGVLLAIWLQTPPAGRTRHACRGGPGADPGQSGAGPARGLSRLAGHPAGRRHSHGAGRPPGTSDQPPSGAEGAGRAGADLLFALPLALAGAGAGALLARRVIRALEAAGWLALAFGLAIASFLLVERPLRRPGTAGPRALVTGALACGAAALAFGAWAWRTDGAPGRFGPPASDYIAASGDFLQDWSRCRTDAADLPGSFFCPIGPETEGPPRIIIWGDSHLRAQMDGLAALAAETGTPA